MGADTSAPLLPSYRARILSTCGRFEVRVVPPRPITAAVNVVGTDGTGATLAPETRRGNCVITPPITALCGDSFG
jgi:hypothetical protein